MVWDEFYISLGAYVGYDPNQGQSQSQDFCGNFGVRQNFGLHRVDK